MGGAPGDLGWRLRACPRTITVVLEWAWALECVRVEMLCIEFRYGKACAEVLVCPFACMRAWGFVGAYEHVVG
eukprot:4071669-Pleurochrysis_carterae.AAC.1